MHLDHTIVPSADKRESARFFVDILGFMHGDSLPDADFVHVDDKLTLRCDQKYAHTVHLAFLVDQAELEAVIARADTNGIPYGSRANQMDRSQGQYAGGPRIYLRDPSNNSIELVTIPTVRSSN